MIRWVARRGGDALLAGFSWLIPLVDFLSAPLTPLLSRLVEVEEDAPESGGVPDAAKEEATKDAEVRALLDVAREEGLLEKHEEELVPRAVDFNDRTVGQVMTPRPDIVYAQAEAPLDEIADLFVKTKFTRLPLVEGSIDKPVGIVHVKDVFTVLRRPDPPATARPLAREVFFAPESQTVATLLADFRRRRHPLAIVVDEYGAVTGLATLEDLVEELVGEIADEHEDEAPPVVAAGDGSWSVAGRVRVQVQQERKTLPPWNQESMTSSSGAGTSKNSPYISTCGSSKNSPRRPSTMGCEGSIIQTLSFSAASRQRSMQLAPIMRRKIFEA